MKKDRKTTIAGVLTGVAGLALAVATYLNTGTIDYGAALTSLTAILGGLGLVVAADSTKADSTKKEGS